MAAYTVNRNNRLVLSTRKGKVTPRGKFLLDSRNRLVYLLNEPSSWKKTYEAPSKIVSQGTWSLTKDYDLVLRYRASRLGAKRSRLVLRGNIVRAEDNALVFEVTGLDRDNHTSVQLLTLNGFWQADKNNRIQFIAKNKPDPDTLTLGSDWDIGNDHHLLYSFEKRNLRSGRKKEHTLMFKGHWRIDRARTLTYILGENPKSSFDFRAELKTPTLYPKAGEIRYNVGAGFRKDRPLKNKIIALYGEWKFGKAKDLSFNMDYGKEGVRKIDFTYSLRTRAKNEIILSLANKRSEQLGMSLTLNRFFVKKSSGKLFLRLKNNEEEKRIETGASLTF